MQLLFVVFVSRLRWCLGGGNAPNSAAPIFRDFDTTPEGELANPTKMCPAIIPTADRKSTQACDGEASRGSQVRRICPSRPSRVD